MAGFAREEHEQRSRRPSPRGKSPFSRLLRVRNCTYIPTDDRMYVCMRVTIDLAGALSACDTGYRAETGLRALRPFGPHVATRRVIG
jgi:hypothetical protein